MTVQPSDVFETLRKCRMDLTNAQVKITDALNYLAALGVKPAEPREIVSCQECGMYTGYHLHWCPQAPPPTPDPLAAVFAEHRAANREQAARLASFTGERANEDEEA